MHEILFEILPHHALLISPFLGEHTVRVKELDSVVFRRELAELLVDGDDARPQVDVQALAAHLVVGHVLLLLLQGDVLVVLPHMLKQSLLVPLDRQDRVDDDDVVRVSVLYLLDDPQDTQQDDLLGAPLDRQVVDSDPDPPNLRVETVGHFPVHEPPQDLRRRVSADAQRNAVVIPALLLRESLVEHLLDSSVALLGPSHSRPLPLLRNRVSDEHHVQLVVSLNRPVERPPPLLPAALVSVPGGALPDVRVPVVLHDALLVKVVLCERVEGEVILVEPRPLPPNPVVVHPLEPHVVVVREEVVLVGPPFRL
mmetsp:Transcript_4300/g.8982  ORF Transcript_4300/g.8982 Transcript_4300/m.8982 type:complete len:311 (-) Transcript_4300:538-1470(-)